MQPNPLLSITIPTYNRALFLDRCLDLLIESVKDYDIEIFISDNASVDSTCEVVKKYKQKYNFIQYAKNDENIGPDDNFERALNLPDTDYVWLLGDGYCIPKNGIKYIFKELSNGEFYDGFLFNLVNKKSYIKDKKITDKNELLSTLGALMTCLSCFVYHKSIIHSNNFNRYKNTYFIQTGITFEYIANRNFCISWVSSLSVEGIESEGLLKRNWPFTELVFDIFCDKWPNFVISLPVTYSLDSKALCVKDFGVVSTVFSMKRLLDLRERNLLRYDVYKKHRMMWCFITSIPSVFILMLCFVPRTPLRIMHYIYTRFYKKKI